MKGGGVKKSKFKEKKNNFAIHDTGQKLGELDGDRGSALEERREGIRVRMRGWHPYRLTKEEN